jgi:outer membrane protein assembly factor BamB
MPASLGGAADLRLKGLAGYPAAERENRIPHGRVRRPVSRRSWAYGFVLILLVGSPLAAAHDLDGPWPQWRRGPARNGAGLEYLPAACDLLWKFHHGHAESSSVVAALGYVAFGSGDGNVYVINATTGQRAWAKPIGGHVLSTPLIELDRLYVAGVDGKVRAFGLATGEEKWTYEAGASFESSPALVEDVLYIGDNAGTLHAIAAADGASKWKRPLGSQALYSSPAVIHGRVYVGSVEGKIHALEATNGNILWSYTTEAAVYSTLTAARGRLVAADYSGRLYVMDPVEARPPLGPILQLGPFAASPATLGPLAFVASTNHRLYAVDVTQVTPRWNVSLGGPILSSPAIIQRVVLVGGADGNLHQFDADTGAPLRQCPTGDAIFTAPAVAHGVVYVISRDGHLYAFGDKDPPPNRSPQVSAFVPSDGSIHRPLDVPLTWVGLDPDAGDSLRYDVRFGTTSTPTVKAQGLDVAEWRPAGLAPSQTYYWQVVARDNHGATAEGPVLQFTTRAAADAPPDEDGRAPAASAWAALLAALGAAWALRPRARLK